MILYFDNWSWTWVTRKRWRKYRRQLERLGRNPDYLTAKYQIHFFQ